MKKAISMLAAAVLIALPLAGCSNSDDEGSGEGTINYWLWDAAQQPQYQECADAFTKANPGYNVKITQYGWADYWNTLTTAFVSDSAPDVFVSHLSYYPQFASKNQLKPLNEYVDKDKVDMGAYQTGLAELWTAKDGKRYGIPKDYDTVAVVYNTQKLQEAGISPEEMTKLTWNPQDGGSYGKIIAKLTVDNKGVRGDQPGFDKKNVVTHGLGLNSSGGAFGQTEWSQYAMSNGWEHAESNPWATKFRYNDPKFKETIVWFRSLIEKGYMPGLDVVGSGGKTIVQQPDAYGAGKYAMVTEGSWNTKTYWALKGVKSALAPTPVGPSGKRASMINGLADNISAGSKNPEAAWKWVKFLGSKECQADIVAKRGVIFPALKDATTAAEAAFAGQGIDVKPFTVHLADRTTHLAPIADHWSDIAATMMEALESYLLFKADINTLDAANQKVNGLFK